VPSTPLHLQVSTTDPEAANEALRQVYSRARMGTIDDPSSFLYRQEVHGDSELTLGRLTFRGSIAGHMVLEENFSVVLPRSGSLDWEIAGRKGSGLSLFMVQPAQDYFGAVDRLAVDSVNLSRPALQDTARTVFGDERLEVAFEHPRPVSPAREKYWRTTYDFVQQALADPAVADVPLLRADLLRQISVATLETFALCGDVQARRASTAARQAAYRRAVEFVDAAVSLPITVEDIARHVGLSTLELTRAFRSHAGTTPAAHLRGLRLAAAHEDLVHGDPAEGHTVAEIAARWGFAHPGDFARRHRQAYGENPGRTLRH
jgi:AraC-like DNA-binding protein